MKVGDKVFVFDSNYRVYDRSDGKPFGGPVYREHFRERVILGETSRSWLVGYEGWSLTSCTKHPKKGRTALYTLEQIAEEEYRHYNAHRIADRVQHADYAVLKQIAALLGYKETV